LFGCDCDLGGELQRYDYEGLAAIGADDQQISLIEPTVQLSKTLTANLTFAAAIYPQNRNREIANVLAASNVFAASAARQRNALGGNSGALQERL
jgi:hypothetical protein